MKANEMEVLIKKIMEGCKNVKEDPNCHAEAKTLAILIMNDCKKVMEDE
jgi:hypothetical protein